jgi:hypothetical protein
LAQGFPVTGADSRTAVNNAMGGKTQMVGLIAGGAMLEMAAAGVSVYYARVKRHLERFFNDAFAQERRKQAKKYCFQTLKPAINAYLKYQRAKGLIAADSGLGDPESDDAAWREPVEPPRTGNRDLVPAASEDEAQREPGQRPDG